MKPFIISTPQKFDNIPSCYVEVEKLLIFKSGRGNFEILSGHFGNLPLLKTSPFHFQRPTNFVRSPNHTSRLLGNSPEVNNTLFVNMRRCTGKGLLFDQD